MTVASSSSTGLRTRRPGGAATAATLGAAALTTWSAIIHLHLWSVGYRHIPDIGRLFLAQGLAGLVVAGASVMWRRPLTAVIGAAFLAATSSGLVLSATVGVFHFHDGVDAPYAGLALVVQGSGFVLFVLAAALSGRRAGIVPAR
jgi:hypothetical protein